MKSGSDLDRQAAAWQLACQSESKILDYFWKEAILFLNLSTRPPASTNFCLPVKKGWHLEQISTLRSPPLVDLVSTTSPQAHLIMQVSYFGWIPSFIVLYLISTYLMFFDIREPCHARQTKVLYHKENKNAIGFASFFQKKSKKFHEKK